LPRPIQGEFYIKVEYCFGETDESYFWLEFIIDEGLLKRELVGPLLKEADELTAIFVSSRKTTRQNN